VIYDAHVETADPQLSSAGVDYFGHRCVLVFGCVDPPALRRTDAGGLRRHCFRSADTHSRAVLSCFGYQNTQGSVRRRVVLCGFVGRADSLGEYLYLS
jgi:hypothetical protein